MESCACCVGSQHDDLHWTLGTRNYDVTSWWCVDDLMQTTLNYLHGVSKKGLCTLFPSCWSHYSTNQRGIGLTVAQWSTRKTRTTPLWSELIQLKNKGNSQKKVLKRTPQKGPNWTKKGTFSVVLRCQKGLFPWSKLFPSKRPPLVSRIDY